MRHLRNNDKFKQIQLMGLFSFLTISDNSGKIRVLQSTIENHQRCISVERDNMARYRAQKAPQHYQDSGKRKIAYYQDLIKKCRADIANLKKK